MTEVPPSDSNEDFRSFRRRLLQGESEAAGQLFDNYSHRLIQLASKNIHPALLKRFDGEDIVQSVFRSFFRRAAEHRFQIEHSQQLWQLLATITLFKARSHARRHTAEKRNASIEQEIDSPDQLLNHDPAPEDALAMWEEIDLVLKGLPERTGEIISMRLEGCTRSEIANQLGLSRQTIHRILKLVQERLELRFDAVSEHDSDISKENEESG